MFELIKSLINFLDNHFYVSWKANILDHLDVITVSGKD